MSRGKIKDYWEVVFSFVHDGMAASSRVTYDIGDEENMLKEIEDRLNDTSGRYNLVSIQKVHKTTLKDFKQSVLGRDEYVWGGYRGYDLT